MGLTPGVGPSLAAVLPLASVLPLGSAADGVSWQDNPLLSGLAGGVVGALAALVTALLVGRQQRRHDRETRRAEWDRQDSLSRAAARQQRFDAALSLATVAAQDAADTARSLRVLDALLRVGGEPDAAVADLPLRAMSVQDPDLRADVERVAELLATYRVGQAAAAAAALADLRAAVPAIARDMAAEALARAEDLTVLSTTGRTAVHAEVEALRSGRL